MRYRLGSADSVVFPVPLNPKSNDERSRLLVCGRRAVHRENAPLRRKIVSHGEYALLHLADIFGPKNHEFPVLKIEADPILRSDIGHQVVRRKNAGVVNHEVRLTKGREFVGGGPD